MWRDRLRWAALRLRWTAASNQAPPPLAPAHALEPAPPPPPPTSGAPARGRVGGPIFLAAQFSGQPPSDS